MSGSSTRCSICAQKPQIIPNIVASAPGFDFYAEIEITFGTVCEVLFIKESTILFILLLLSRCSEYSVNILA